MMFEANTTPPPEMLKVVRGLLVMQGSSLAEWARDNNVKRQNLTKALKGEWRGPKAQEILEKISKDVGLKSVK